MMQKYLRFLWLSLLLASFQTHADSDGKQFTSHLGFKLGTVTLVDVQKKLGSAQLITAGEGGAHEISVCYVIQNGYVSFLSSGEMGGSNHQLLGFGVSKFNKEDAKQCAQYPGKPKFDPAILEIAGLHLGMSKEQFKKIVSTKVEWDGEVGSGIFASKKTMSAEELVKFTNGDKTAQNYFDVTISVTGNFNKNKLEAFEIWKVETY